VFLIHNGGWHGCVKGNGGVMEMFKVSEFPGDVNSGAAPTIGAGRAACGPIPAISGGSQRTGTFIVDIRRKTW
jgi:hypothetical protein